ncbi:MAG TPA: RNA methyltransferase [Chitinophagaceae bacterium]|nr:RNA methyltransferase [Chitinophagaceae bacterium]
MVSKAQIKYIRSLREKKYRQKFGQFTAEGEKTVSEFLAKGNLRITGLFGLKDWAEQYLQGSPGGLAEFHEVSSGDMSRLSSLSTPSRVMGLIDLPLPEPEPDFRGKLTLVADDIQDPGNMGTLVRTAAWFGITRLVHSPGSADPFGPKAVQGSMGSLGGVSVLEMDLTTLLKDHPNIPSFAAVIDGTDIRGMGPQQQGLILIGNESRGVAAHLAARCSHRISIRGMGEIQSLNAAVAAGIICAKFSGVI